MPRRSYLEGAFILLSNGSISGNNGNIVSEFIKVYQYCKQSPVMSRYLLSLSVI